MHKRTIRRLILLLLLSPIHVFPSQSRTKPVAIVIGTRPEAIKMIPVYIALKQIGIPTQLCSTGQHTDLLEDIFSSFNVAPDISFNIMKQDQDLFHITTAVLAQMKEYLLSVDPVLVLVQGDTTSAMTAALAAFYLKIPVGHVEAGLRSGNMYAPYPEEMNRKMISILATYHFAPTTVSVENLHREQISADHIFCVGNTVVDALLTIRKRIARDDACVNAAIKNSIADCKQRHKKIMLLTAHRRESFAQGLSNIFNAVKKILDQHPELFVIYPMHPNPNIREIFQQSELSGMSNIQVTPALNYIDLCYILDAADIIATDSGGIQEEGVSLGKPVLVLRNETDRPEGIIAGIATLVGTHEDQIIDQLHKILEENNFSSQRESHTIYGDGNAAIQIASLITQLLQDV